MDNLHEVDFVVKLTGSQLFDIHSYVTAKHLCDMFPPLQFEHTKEQIHIHGQLNDSWYEQWCRALFSIGEVNL